MLSLLAPGVGQLYAGENRSGWRLFGIFVALELASAFVLPNLPIKVRAAALLLLALADLALRVWAGIAAFRLARRLRAVAVGRYQHGWIYTLLILLMPVANALAAPDHEMKSFYAPSGAMLPTLRANDYFVVDRGYYRRNPVSRGDLIVFKLPTDTSTDYIKRIVGLPGDRIQVRHGELYINDQQVPRKEDPNCRDKEADPFVVQQGYRESLPSASGGAAVQHCIIKEFGFNGREDGPLDNTPVYDVPAGHYFAMGDNRDNSQDSRVLTAVGYIPAENLVGRAQFIFFSTDGSAHGWEVWKWPFAIRYSRLFRGVS